MLENGQIIDFEIIGSDIDEHCLDVARKGLYNIAKLSSVLTLYKKYFLFEKQQLLVKNKIAKKVSLKEKV